jgi:sulfur carrier protein ThiS
MKVCFKYQGKSKKIALSAKSKVSDLLEKSGINPETVIIRREGIIIPYTGILKNKDKLEAIKVISGG